MSTETSTGVGKESRGQGSAWGNPEVLKKSKELENSPPYKTQKG